ncbi:MAG: hypothetical protein AAF669_07950 [Pseudomonadota bacterium]
MTILETGLDTLQSTSVIDPTRNLLTVPMIKITENKKKNSILLPYDKNSLTVDYTHNNKTQQFIGGGYKIMPTGTEPGKLAVNFLLDDTTFSFAPMYLSPRQFIPASVDKKIKMFMALCYSEEKNEPNLLTLKAPGFPLMPTTSQVFTGILENLKVKTEIVDLTGARAKAELECNFIFQKKTEHQSQKKTIQVNLKG